LQQNADVVIVNQAGAKAKEKRGSVMSLLPPPTATTTTTSIFSANSQMHQ
jgi:hypothetical protein